MLVLGLVAGVVVEGEVDASVLIEDEDAVGDEASAYDQ